MFQKNGITSATQYEVYIGDTDFGGNFESQNSLCYKGDQEGLANCEGAGRYLQFKAVSPSSAMIQFSEILVFDETDLAQLGTLSVDVPFSVKSDGTYSNLNRQTDWFNSGYEKCVEGKFGTSKSFEVIVAFSKPIEMTSAAIFT